MSTRASVGEPGHGGGALLQALAPYQQPSLRRARGQLLPTLAGYLGLMVAMMLMLRAGWSYLLVLPLLVLAGGFLVRVFIFFHDACHQSYFRATWANVVLGYLTGLLTLTPYHAWRAGHLRHHTTAGDLDRRGVGDVWTMTLEEYRHAPRLTRLAYRLFRHPLVMFGLGPGAVFLLANRLPPKGDRLSEHLSVHGTTLGLAALVVLGWRVVGLGPFLAVLLPVALVAAALGVWLFYVQHQFRGVYWSRHAQWDPFRAALEGSSYYRLPRLLQWFAGNIGFHHIHHLRPRIPNYNLPLCQRAIPALAQVRPLTLRASLGCLGLRLWDEERCELVGFAALRRQPR